MKVAALATAPLRAENPSQVMVPCVPPRLPSLLRAFTLASTQSAMERRGEGGEGETKVHTEWHLGPTCHGT